MRIKLLVLLGITLVSSSGCETMRPIARYTEVADAFSKSVATASDVLKKSLAEDTRVQRQAAFQLYIEAGDDAKNIHRKFAIGSFANLACAGTKSVRARANLRYLEQYGNAMSGVLKAPENGVIAIAQHIEALRKPAEPLGLPKVTDDQFVKCRSLVEDTLKMRGLALQTEDQAALARFGLPASVIAFQEAIKAIAKVAESVLKIIDEAARKKAFEEIVKVNENQVKAVLADQSINESLKLALQQRRLVALYGPYLRFQGLLRLNGADDAGKVAIWREATKIHDELADFDGIRLSTEPVDITKAMMVAHDKVIALAEGKASIEDVLAYLKALASQLEEIKKDVDDAEKKLDKIG